MSEEQPVRLSSGQDMRSDTKVFAIIVTFNPGGAVFRRLLEAILPQVNGVIIVDNGSRDVDIARICAGFPESSERIGILPLHENLGIAVAQNRGVERAKAAGAGYVLLLDHDSVPMEGMVEELLRADRQLRSKGMPVGAVGAVTFDRRTGTSSKVLRAEGWRVLRLPSLPSDDYAEADFLVASGTMIALPVLERHGMMDESYFIDHVDTEWCFRVRARGMRLFVVPRARLEHAIGDQIVCAWFLRWYEVPIHSPVRDYYTFRNIIRLLLTVPMSRAWRVMYFYRLVQYGGFFSFCMPPRLRRIKLMGKGIVDGLLRRGGPLVEK